MDKHIGADGLANHDYNRDHEMCGSGNLLGGSTNVCSSNTQQRVRCGPDMLAFECYPFGNAVTTSWAACDDTDYPKNEKELL